MSGEQAPTRLPGLLSRLQAVWEEQGAPMARLSRPGLSDAELDAHAATLGVVLPEELRQWWRWRNGATPAPNVAAESVGPGGWSLIGLEKVADERNLLVQSHADMGIPGVVWDQSWLPITKGPWCWLFAKTAEAAAGRVPVGLVEWPWEGEFAATVLPSLTDMVALWVQMLDEGFYAWDPGTNSWRIRFADIPLDIRMTRVV